ncbi:MAG: Hsp20/alpha crystallin family protein [Gammaproteobacteria bacterium]
MSTLEHFREGLNHFWEGLAEGWQQLRQRAGQAMTRFNPLTPPQAAVETAESQIIARGSRWGLLTAEVEERDTEVVVRLEAPGMEADDFTLSVQDTYLVVRGEKHARREHKHGRYHIMECAYGQFERAVPLPASVDEDATRASYRKGVLTVTLPKRPGSQRRRIDIQTG